MRSSVSVPDAVAYDYVLFFEGNSFHEYAVRGARWGPLFHSIKQSRNATLSIPKQAPIVESSLEKTKKSGAVYAPLLESSGTRCTRSDRSNDSGPSPRSLFMKTEATGSLWMHISWKGRWCSRMPFLGWPSRDIENHLLNEMDDSTSYALWMFGMIPWAGCQSTPQIVFRRYSSDLRCSARNLSWSRKIERLSCSVWAYSLWGKRKHGCLFYESNDDIDYFTNACSAALRIISILVT